jgi:hypothetical protein
MWCARVVVVVSKVPKSLVVKVGFGQKTVCVCVVATRETRPTTTVRGARARGPVRQAPPLARGLYRRARRASVHVHAHVLRGGRANGIGLPPLFCRRPDNGLRTQNATE